MSDWLKFPSELPSLVTAGSCVPLVDELAAWILTGEWQAAASTAQQVLAFATCHHSRPTPESPVTPAHLSIAAFLLVPHMWRA